jgi:hypothetical protein
MPNLRTLVLQPIADLDLTDEDMDKAGMYWPNLEKLRLGKCIKPKITHEGLLNILRHCPNLEDLAIPWASYAFQSALSGSSLNNPSEAAAGFRHEALKILTVHHLFPRKIQNIEHALSIFIASIAPNLETFSTTHPLRSTTRLDSIKKLIRLYQVARADAVRQAMQGITTN